MLRSPRVFFPLLLVYGCAVPVPSPCEQVVCGRGSCVARGESVLCACDAEESAWGVACAIPERPETFSRPLETLAIGQPHEDRFVLPGSTHRYRMELTRGQTYRLTCGASRGECAVEVRLHETIMRFATGDAEDPAVIEILAQASSPYEVAVSGGIDGGDAYRLLAEELIDVIPGTLSDAPLVQLDAEIAGRIESAFDRDTYRLELPTSGWFTVELNAEAPGVHAHLYDADGRRVYSGYEVDGWAARGTAWVSITGAGEGAATYVARVRLNKPDDHGDGVYATQIPVGEFVSGVIDDGRDVDAFAIAAVSGRVYQTECIAESSPTGCATVFGQKAVADGPLHFRVFGPIGMRYRFRAVDGGTDDHPSFRPEATLVTPGPVRLRYQYDGDVDIIAIDVDAGEVLMTDGLEVLSPAEGSYSRWVKNLEIWAAVPTRFYLSRASPYPPPIELEATLSIHPQPVAVEPFAESR